MTNFNRRKGLIGIFDPTNTFEFSRTRGKGSKSGQNGRGVPDRNPLRPYLWNDDFDSLKTKAVTKMGFISWNIAHESHESQEFQAETPWFSKSLLDSIDRLDIRIDTVQIKRRKHLKDDGNIPYFTIGKIIFFENNLSLHDSKFICGFWRTIHLVHFWICLLAAALKGF